MAESVALSPEPRVSHESALIGDELHLFGGIKGTLVTNFSFFPRNEIWTCDVRDQKKKWIRRFTKGITPPPCRGAQCVVVDGIVYSYGGALRDMSMKCLEDIYGLDPKNIKWMKVATPVDGKKPWGRHSCCLWAIGGRAIVFGGASADIPPNRLQLGAQFKSKANNEIYEFVFEEGREKGYWLDVELSGIRPKQRSGAAVETIDGHRGLLHGGSYSCKQCKDAFVIDLEKKQWIPVKFSPAPCARHFHRICQISTKKIEEKCFLLIGGSAYRNQSTKVEEDRRVHVLDFNKRRSHELYLNPEIAPIHKHTLHCVENRDGSRQIIVVGGEDKAGKMKEILNEFSLVPSNESFVQIDLPSAQEISKAPKKRSRETEREIEDLGTDVLEVQNEGTQLEAGCLSLEEENTRLTEQRSGLERRCSSLQRRENGGPRDKYRKDVAFAFEMQTSELETRCDGCTSLQKENEALRAKCHVLQTEKTDVAKALEAQTSESETHCRSLQREIEFLTARCRDLDTETIKIPSTQVFLSNEKLGSGSYADVIIGRWHSVPVAVKKFHDLITTRRTIPIFQREVRTASRLRHPSIISVCGAVMEDGIPFQIVCELLEGSVSEVIDAAHASPCYLSQHEQLSIVLEMTSGIDYLHGRRPRPYVHADIRPTNVLVTSDMKVKVADLGAAHVVESSISAGILSGQYLAPERMPPMSGRSSLPSDVYSLGVSLIEIFTGEGPVPEERNRQRLMIIRPRLRRICSLMISDEERIGDRPSSAECLDVLEREIGEIVRNGFPATKRLVKGGFEGEGAARRHKVNLSDYYHF